MFLPDVTLHEPRSLEEAAAVLRRLGPRARVMAGGTDVLVDLKTRRIAAESLVCLSEIGGLRGVAASPEGLCIGALTTVSELHRSPLLAGPYAAIRDATRDMAATQVRNLATVGGNIAGGVPCADLPPILEVFSASVRLWSAEGERELALESFLLGPRTTALREGELLTQVFVPPTPSRFGAAYARFALRDGNAIAVAGVAASVGLDGRGRIAAARVALNAVAPVARLVGEAAAALCGRTLDEAVDDAAAAAVAAADPISDIRASAEYRRELVAVLARRALVSAHARAVETGP